MADYNYYSKLSRAADVADKRDRLLYRFFEMLPGILAWLTLIAIFVFSFRLPTFMAIFIIIFDVYWFIKTVYLSLHLRSAFRQVRQNMGINWLERLTQLPTTNYQLPTVHSWHDIYHLVLLPMYKEPFETVDASIASLARANYPQNKMIVVLAQEERAGEEFNREVASMLEAKYRDTFFKFVTVEHPGSITGELAGKGSNIAYAGKWVKENIIDPAGMSYERIIVSALDIDTVVFPEYFGRLAYVYLTAEDPLHASYQPVPFYTNNIWEAPGFARVVAFSATFWHTIKQERIESSTTFSSHSMPFQVLADIDFWQVNMVSEDSRIFWQAFLRYNGRYRNEPLFYPVSMDANVAHSFRQTMINVYKQQRRWGYGVENVPYFLFGFAKNKLIPLKKKLFMGFTILESFWSWATNAIIIFLLGWLPIALGGAEFNRTVLSYNLPFITRGIMTFAMVGLVSSVILSMLILPPRPPRFGRHKYIFMIIQWALMPLTMILLGALPGLEAQSRLMLGKYMGFWVTPKGKQVLSSKQ
ncbi:MAG: glycosyltransferase family 2 protein [bacterium]|nr:glycosyltransferase family 2 protein [bacterium]